MTLRNRMLCFVTPVSLIISAGFGVHSTSANPVTASTTCLSKSIDGYRIAQTSAKRCEFVMETKNPNATDKTVKTCSYKCKGYGALANFSWPINQPCPPSFDTNFPGP
jgi:hypothetical protein